MPKITTLALLTPPALARIVWWLLGDSSHIRVLAPVGRRQRLGRIAGRLRPQLLLVSAELLAKEQRNAVEAVKRSSPGSKLILICTSDVLAHEARRWGADACLQTAVLVRRLLPTVQKLVVQTGDRKRRGA